LNATRLFRPLAFVTRGGALRMATLATLLLIRQRRLHPLATVLAAIGFAGRRGARAGWVGASLIDGCVHVMAPVEQGGAAQGNPKPGEFDVIFHAAEGVSSGSRVRRES
jgi:hypothetical protein